jgi:hypothetical protein
MFHVEHCQPFVLVPYRQSVSRRPIAGEQPEIGIPEFLSLDWSFALFRSPPLLPFFPSSARQTKITYVRVYSSYLSKAPKALSRDISTPFDHIPLTAHCHGKIP